MINYTIKTANKITEFPVQDWNRVFPSTVENYYFSKTLDELRSLEFSFFYIMVYAGPDPVGAATCFTMNFPLDITVKGVFKFTLDFLKKMLPGIVSPKMLMCGLPMGLGRIGIADSADKNKVIKCIYEALDGIAEKEKAPIIVFKDFGNEYNELLKPFTKQGFVKIESLPSTEMNVDFKNFDGFLQSLSPVSRNGLKRKFKKIDGKIKIELEVKPALGEPDLSRVYELYLQTVNLHNDGIEVVPKDFFIKISQNMPHEVKYFLWRIEGKIVAFAFCFVFKDLFVDYYLGFDYSLAYEYQLYFIRFRDLMNWCISNKIKKYEMGVTGYEPKRRLNFEFIRLYYYMKHRNRIFNIFFGFFSNLFKPSNFDPVFKEINNNPA